MSFAEEDCREVVELIESMSQENQNKASIMLWTICCSTIPIFISTVKRMLEGGDAYGEVFTHKGKFVHIDYSVGGAPNDLDMFVEICLKDEWFGDSLGMKDVLSFLFLFWFYLICIKH